MPPSVKKAVIPAAGLGTRFFPITKAVPKELLLVYDKPSIEWIMEELMAAGIQEVIFVLSPGREMVFDYFQKDPFLEKELKEKDKAHLLNNFERILDKIKFTKVYQERPLGLGHAILCAKQAVGDEPFIVVLPDDLIDGPYNVCLDFIEEYQKSHCSMVAVERVDRAVIQDYGIVDGVPCGEQLLKVKGLVEKPDARLAPSNLGVVGRYLFIPEIFGYLDKISEGKLGEIQLTDAMNVMAGQEGLLAYEFVGKRLDIGSRSHWWWANLHFGLKDEKVKTRLRKEML